jgi:hypothetical protein
LLRREPHAHPEHRPAAPLGRVWRRETTRREQLTSVSGSASGRTCSGSAARARQHVHDCHMLCCERQPARVALNPKKCGACGATWARPSQMALYHHRVELLGSQRLAPVLSVGQYQNVAISCTTCTTRHKAKSRASTTAQSQWWQFLHSNLRGVRLIRTPPVALSLYVSVCITMRIPVLSCAFVCAPCMLY